MTKKPPLRLYSVVANPGRASDNFNLVFSLAHIMVALLQRAKACSGRCGASAACGSLAVAAVALLQRAEA